MVLLDIIRQLDAKAVLSAGSLYINHPAYAQVADFLANTLILVFVPVLYFLWRSPQPASKHQGNKKAVILALLSLVFVVALKTAIATLYLRARPFVAHPELLHDVLRLDPQSFPSGHTLVAATLTFSLWMSGMKKLGWALFVVTLLVAFGRVAIGVHYPSDVLGGLVFGLFVTWFLHRESSSLKRYLPNA
jgi:membrane-associated phospholipid phosphatase